MKKSKKFLSVLCAVCMILAMAAPAFAVEAYYIPAYDENKQYGLVEHGTFDDGSEYWVINLTPAEIATRSMLRSYDWSDSVKVPISNEAGTNGAILGYSFTASPDPYVVVNIGSLPSVMSTVNVAFYYDNQSNSGHKLSAAGDSTVVFKLKYPSNSGSLKVSTYETTSKSADFSFYTSSTNPADKYIEV